MVMWCCDRSKQFVVYSYALRGESDLFKEAYYCSVLQWVPSMPELVTQWPARLLCTYTTAHKHHEWTFMAVCLGLLVIVRPQTEECFRALAAPFGR